MTQHNPNEQGSQIKPNQSPGKNRRVDPDVQQTQLDQDSRADHAGPNDNKDALTGKKR